MATPGLASAGAGSPNRIAGGVASIPIAPNLLNIAWRLYQVTVAVGSANDKTLRAPAPYSILGPVVTSFAVYLALNGIPITSRSVGQTPICADGDFPIDIGGHDVLTAEVSGISGSPLVTQLVTVAYLYDELGAA